MAIGKLRARAWGVLALSLAAAMPAHASLNGGFVGQTADLQRNRTADLVWGNGGSGPYRLSQRPVMPGSVSVRLDGARELLPNDYRVDYVVGTVTFTAPLPPGHLARVEYAHNPIGKGAAPTSQKGPLSLDLAQVQVGGAVSTLRFSGAWRIPQPGQTAVTALGMGLETKVGANTKISSLVALTPRSARPGGEDDRQDGTGVQVAAETGTQRAQARVSYLRTGEAFGAAQEYQWQRGVERLDVSGAYALNDRLSAKSSFVRTDENVSGAPARTTTLLTNALSAAVTPFARLTLRRSEKQVDGAGGPGHSNVSNQVQLDQRLGKASSAQVRHEVAVAGTGTAEQTTATTGVKLDARLTGNTRVVAERVEVHSEEQDPAVQTQVAVSAGISGGRVKIEGEYQATERPGQADQEVQGARVEARPMDGLKIAGGVRQLHSGAETQLQKHARVEVQAPAGLQVAGSIEQQTDGAGNTTGLVRAVDANLKPFQGVEMSGTYKEREERDQAGPRTQGLRLSLAPAKYLQLSGGLIYNPEEQGKVVQERRQTVGLRSDLGRLTLSGDLAQRYDPSARPLAEEMQVGAALQLTGFDRIFTSYKLAEEAGGSSLTTNCYTFGYARRIANALNLSLEGEYLQREQASRALNNGTEARARASLNMRF